MLSQGELEKIPIQIESAMASLEARVMDDVIERIKENGFVANTTEYELRRLQQFGMTTEHIEEWIAETLDYTSEQIDNIFGERLYEEYFGFKKGYDMRDMDFIPFEDNVELQMLASAIIKQTNDECKNITGSLGFAINNNGRIKNVELSEFYQNTLDTAIYDIQTGMFDYNTVLNRTINTLTKSGLRTINYKTGRSTRVEVAARRAVMTGWRQIQGKINEQVARDLNTDSYEVSVHMGARPSHREWQGKVYTMEGLISICGLGTVTGLHGANCYHDYNAFIDGVSVRTYTDEELEKINAEEEAETEYNGKRYNRYDALQRQRQLERNMRAQRQRISLLRTGNADEDSIINAKCRYQAQMQEYNDFTAKMKLPSQMERVYQDGLRGQKFLPTAKEQKL